jgi:hypothetical protein
MPKISDKVLLQKASAAHNNKFTYGDFVKHPKGRGMLFTVLCPAHGEFLQPVTAHLSGKGCKACAMAALREKNMLTLDEVKSRTESFGRNYTYLALDYSVATAPTITYICPTHGEMTQNVHNHLAGKGCSVCMKRTQGVKQRSVGRSRAHVGLSDLELLAVASALPDSNRFSALRIEANKDRRRHVVSLCAVHGEFRQPLYERLINGRGCSKCAATTRAEKVARDFNTLVAQGRSAHGEKYEYLSFEKRNGVLWVNASCPAHGSFWQYGGGHFSGYGCTKCGDDVMAGKLSKSMDQWVVEARAAHGDLYEYKSLVPTRLEKVKLEVICKSHGAFLQTASSHIGGAGCPSCSTRISKPQAELISFISTLGVAYEVEYKIPDSRLILDIYIPSKQLGIELNGIYWHSDRHRSKEYHAKKQFEAAKAGIDIIHVFDDELEKRKLVVERAIKHRLGLTTEPKISARTCNLQPVSVSLARAFMEQNHIQGFVGAGVYYGLLESGVLVAVAGFTMKNPGRAGRKSDTRAELVRYSTSAHVRGGLSRLISHAQASLGFRELITFSDIRFFNGKTYETVGFSQAAVTPPDYFYTKGGIRVHKSRLQKSRVRSAAEKGLALFDPSLTELELSQLNGYSRVWDCGKVRWVKYW